MTAKYLPRLLILSLVLSATANTVQTEAQTILGHRSGIITFFSSTPVEDIKATNNSFTSAVNLSDSTVVFRVNITGFVFRKKLMQEHFNDQYLESKMFPAATFTGKLENPREFLGNPASGISTRVSGELTIKGVTRRLNKPV
ncbi:MAG: YceI family protein, partial [Bacteroidales bacterium]|nr:YceI family protein [Bacteroidales bacterium]